MFRSYDELQPFVPPQMVGTYQSRLPNDIEGVPTILASGTLSPFGRVVVCSRAGTPLQSRSHPGRRRFG